jgi:hypothetical protein
VIFPGDRRKWIRAYRLSAWLWLIAGLAAILSLNFAFGARASWLAFLLPWAACELLIVYLRKTSLPNCNRKRAHGGFAGWLPCLWLRSAPGVVGQLPEGNQVKFGPPRGARGVRSRGCKGEGCPPPSC